jgi:hypothetical protein
MTSKAIPERTARCGCGQLTATTHGEPVEVFLCSCLDCQRRSGGAFSYAALFPAAAVTIRGEQRTWRHDSDAGRWIDTMFCPTCGVSVYSIAEAFPQMVCVAVGCFADPEFAKPANMYWASRRHHWFMPPDGVQQIDTQ